MKIFDSDYLDALVAAAKCSFRLRQHSNIHQSYDDPSQCLFNAVEPHSYIRPHRHVSDPKDERLLAVRGLMALLVFDDLGDVINVICFGTEKYGNQVAIGVSIPSYTWHTVIALETSSILCEVKAGPFDPNRPKDLATWAPSEDSDMANSYLNRMHQLVSATVPNSARRS